METNNNQIRRALEQTTPPVLPADFTDRLMSSLYSEQRRRERRKTLLWIVGGVVFLTALLVGLFWYFDLRLPALRLPSWRISADEGRLIGFYLYIGLLSLGLLVLDGYLRKKLLQKRS